MPLSICLLLRPAFLHTVWSDGVFRHCITLGIISAPAGVKCLGACASVCDCAVRFVLCPLHCDGGGGVGTRFGGLRSSSRASSLTTEGGVQALLANPVQFSLVTCVPMLRSASCGQTRLRGGQNRNNISILFPSYSMANGERTSLPKCCLTERAFNCLCKISSLARIIITRGLSTNYDRLHFKQASRR